MKKKKVILSFDYELFFGDKSGTVLKTLIEPTNKILDAMDSDGFKGNFFIDWQMLKYLKEENTERTLSDYNLIKNQLKDMVRRGHRIELHIHPHWVDAKYNGDGTWDFSEFRHYSLNSFSEDEITEMFVEGTNLLESIAREIDPTYKIIAFRAGGWAVQPFSKLKKGFIKAGIKVDSSVMPGIYAERENSFYDFRNISNVANGKYNFEDDVCAISGKGQFIEVPISCTRHYLINRIVNYLYHLLGSNYQCLTDGTHIRQKESAISNLKKKHTQIPLTFSASKPLNTMLYLLMNKGSLLCYIDHPKDFSHYTLKSMKLVLSLTVSQKYKDLLQL